MNSQPRVASSMLKSGQYLGQDVLFVGKVRSSNGQVAALEDHEGQLTNVMAAPGTSYIVGNVYEVLGLVMQDLSVQEKRCVAFGTNFGPISALSLTFVTDVKNYGGLLKAATTAAADIF